MSIISEIQRETLSTVIYNGTVLLNENRNLMVQAITIRVPRSEWTIVYRNEMYIAW